MNELRPCPFCGNAAQRRTIAAGQNAGASYIACTKCEASTALYGDRKENLTDAWNQRSRRVPASVGEAIGSALAAAAYIRHEADFNRSWTDGRRGDPSTKTAGYIARRIALAEERERWAAAIETLVAAHV
ncbi:Lar family restriction alleviation protein [Xanthobacter sediminis]